jgi:hypothetical protein
MVVVDEDATYELKVKTENVSRNPLQYVGFLDLTA